LRDRGSQRRLRNFRTVAVNEPIRRRGPLRAALGEGRYEGGRGTRRFRLMTATPEAQRSRSCAAQRMVSSS
jgi:hypothetical protein